MFEWILFGIIAAVTVAACVTIDTLRKAMTKAKVNLGEIIDIDRVHNKVTLQDLESRVQITVTGDNISNKIHRGRKIRRKTVVTVTEHGWDDTFPGPMPDPEWDDTFDPGPMPDPEWDDTF